MTAHEEVYVAGIPAQDDIGDIAGIVLFVAYVGEGHHKVALAAAEFIGIALHGGEEVVFGNAVCRQPCS